MSDIILSGNLIINDNKEIYLLFRNDHGFYETPGGKVREGEELKDAAKRELLEEVAEIKEIVSMEYFTSIKFIIPDGRTAIANKFITQIKGNLSAKEEDLFDKDKSRWISLKELENYSLSPDLILLLPKIKDYFNRQ